ncbi:hypothetical protein PR048_016343 [Dryococelus australis]|uniref:DDE Tnp4 domain-containing protein n=1 Tax=Dryococelus australis TaxID=614101 RepID=A0ABQ9HJG9_9NEOP|nr:hypothetical protein PR048_016343 [Dryococelus australis]
MKAGFESLNPELDLALLRLVVHSALFRLESLGIPPCLERQQHPFLISPLEAADVFITSSQGTRGYCVLVVGVLPSSIIPWDARCFVAHPIQPHNGDSSSGGSRRHSGIACLAEPLVARGNLLPLTTCAAVDSTVITLLLARLPPRRSRLNPRPGHSGFSHVGIVPDDAADRRVLSEISRSPRPFIPALLLTSITLIGCQDLDVKSLGLQGVADADKTILTIQGKQSDGGIFIGSTLFTLLENGSFNVPEDENLPHHHITLPNFLIGDEAYPLKPYLMRPYPNNILNPQQNAAFYS